VLAATISSSDRAASARRCSGCSRMLTGSVRCSRLWPACRCSRWHWPYCCREAASAVALPGGSRGALLASLLLASPPSRVRSPCLRPTQPEPEGARDRRDDALGVGGPARRARGHVIAPHELLEQRRAGPAPELIQRHETRIDAVATRNPARHRAAALRLGTVRNAEPRACSSAQRHRD
jgi:hypothetical protein